MVTVALIGADGSGKTTIARRIEREGPLPIKYMYMGTNPEALEHALPTTRFANWLRVKLGRSVYHGPPDPARSRATPRSWPGRAAMDVKRTLGLVNRLCQEAYLQCIAWYFQRRGFVVLFDRHFFPDYYAHDIAPDAPRRTLGRRVHGYFLASVYARPDLMIMLDAPASVLFARKREGNIELIERRRQEYLRLRERTAHFHTVDVDQPEEAVAQQVVRHVEAFVRTREERAR